MEAGLAGVEVGRQQVTKVCFPSLQQHSWLRCQAGTTPYRPIPTCMSHTDLYRHVCLIVIQTYTDMYVSYRPIPTCMSPFHPYNTVGWLRCQAGTTPYRPIPTCVSPTDLYGHVCLLSIPISLTQLAAMPGRNHTLHTCTDMYSFFSFCVPP